MYYIHDHLLCTHRVPGDTTGAKVPASMEVTFKWGIQVVTKETVEWKHFFFKVSDRCYKGNQDEGLERLIVNFTLSGEGIRTVP